MNYLFYGLVTSVASFLYSVILYFLGFQTEKLEQGAALGWISLLIFIGGLIWAMASARSEAQEEGKAFGYGSSFKAGILTSLFIGLTGMVLTFVHFNFIAVDYVDYAIEQQEVKMAEQGMADEQIEQASGFTRTFMQPWVMAVIGFISSLFFGLIFSLILAIFIRSKETVQQEV
jgi:hypothetical protein